MTHLSLEPHFWVPFQRPSNPFALLLGFQNTEMLTPGPTLQAALLPLISTSCFSLSGAACLWPSSGSWPLTGQAPLPSPQVWLRHPSLASCISPTIKHQTELLLLPELQSLSWGCDLLGLGTVPHSLSGMCTEPGTQQKCPDFAKVHISDLCPSLSAFLPPDKPSVSLLQTSSVTVTPRSTSLPSPPPYAQLPTSLFGCAHTIPPTSSQRDFISLQTTLAFFCARCHSPEVQNYRIILNSSFVCSTAACRHFIGLSQFSQQTLRSGYSHPDFTEEARGGGLQEVKGPAQGQGTCARSRAHNPLSWDQRQILTICPEPLLFPTAHACTPLFST